MERGKKEIKSKAGNAGEDQKESAAVSNEGFEQMSIPDGGAENKELLNRVANRGNKYS